MAVVKANGYGHGAVPAARAALKGGATWLGVYTPDEALELREVGIAEPILVAGWSPPATHDKLVSHGIDLAVFDVPTTCEEVSVLSWFAAGPHGEQPQVFLDRIGHDNVATGHYEWTIAAPPPECFRQLDLRNPTWPVPTDFPMIFCRNVSIYFAEDERMTLMDRLAHHLRTGGWLAMGNGEILPGVPPSLRKHSPSLFQKEA